MTHLLLGAGLGSPAPASFQVDAAVFDGTNDYAAKSGSVTGLADGTDGTVSFFINFASLTNQQVMLMTSANRFYIFKDSANLLTIFAADTGGSAIWRGRTSAVSVSTWYHFIASWSLVGGSPTTHIYLNDVSDNNANLGPTAGTIDYADALSNQLGADGVGTTKLNASLAEFWFDDTYIDLSVAANRRKFVTASLKPVNLGSDGSTPTGTSPAMYFHLDNGETANNFALNRGVGEDFTVTGALTTAGTSPSD